MSRQFMYEAEGSTIEAVRTELEKIDRKENGENPIVASLTVAKKGLIPIEDNRILKILARHEGRYTDYGKSMAHTVVSELFKSKSLIPGYVYYIDLGVVKYEIPTVTTKKIAKPTKISNRFFVVVDGDSGEVLYENDSLKSVEEEARTLSSQYNTLYIEQRFKPVLLTQINKSVREQGNRKVPSSSYVKRNLYILVGEIL